MYNINNVITTKFNRIIGNFSDFWRFWAFGPENGQKHDFEPKMAQNSRFWLFLPHIPEKGKKRAISLKVPIICRLEKLEITPFFGRAGKGPRKHKKAIFGPRRGVFGADSINHSPQ